MNKEIITYITLILSIIGIHLLTRENDFQKEQDKEVIITGLPEFKRIDIQSSADIYFVEDKEVSIMIQGPYKQVSKVETRVEGGTLIIEDNRNKGILKFFGKYLSQNDLKIYVKTNDLDNISINECNCGESLNMKMHMTKFQADEPGPDIKILI